MITVEPALSQIWLNNAMGTLPQYITTVQPGESVVAGWVLLAGPQSINTTVHIRPTSSLIVMPSSVIIAAWDNIAEFPVMVKMPKKAPPGNVTASIVATVGSTTRTAPLNVRKVGDCDRPNSPAA